MALPTIGRIVLFRHSSGVDFAAMITATLPGVSIVHLTAFPPAHMPLPLVSIEYDDGVTPRPHTWRWPEIEGGPRPFGLAGG